MTYEHECKLGIGNFTLKSSNAVGNAVGRGGVKKLLGRVWAVGWLVFWVASVCGWIKCAGGYCSGCVVCVTPSS